MFGEYGVYCDGKVIGVICGNPFFVKKTKAGAALYPGCQEAVPYTGAKPHFIIDSVDDEKQCAKAGVTFRFKNTGSLFRHDATVEKNQSLSADR